MSSRRSRSGGRRISTVLRRNSRSWRNRPAATSSRRSALVAEMMRTSTVRVLRRADALELAGLQHAQQLRPAASSEMLAISSRNSVPPSASSKRPTRSVLASVKAPRTWPNSSLSNTAFGEAAGVDRDQRLAARGGDGVERPRDDALAGAVLAGDQDVRVRRADALDQLEHRLHRGGLGDQDRARRRRAGSRSRPRAAGRGAAPGASSTWVRRMASSRALSHGFSTKSRAPRRIASTATSTLPQAVITTTGSVVVDGAAAARAGRAPRWPEVVSRV